MSAAVAVLIVISMGLALVGAILAIKVIRDCNRGLEETKAMRRIAMRKRWASR